MADHPVIRVAPEVTYAPFSFMDTKGQHAGLSADYLNLLEEKLQLEFSLAAADDLTGNLQRTAQRDIDVITSVKNTPERAKTLLFTQPYFTVAGVIVVRDGHDTPVSPQQLQGLKVAVGKDTAIEAYMRKEHPHLDYVAFRNDSECLDALAFKRVDAAILDLASASWIMKNRGLTHLQIAGDTGFTYSLSFATRNDWPELRDILDKALASVSEAEHKEIQSKWIATVPNMILFDGRAWQAILWFTGGVLCLTVIIFGWNRSLQEQTKIKTRALRAELALRKDAEDKLRVTEERLSFALDAAGDGVWDYDFTTGIIQYSHQWKAMLGYQDDDIGNGFGEWLDRIHPDDRQAALDRLNAYLSKETETYDIRLRLRCKDNSYKWILSRGNIVSRDADGKPTRMVGTHTDVSALKEAELREIANARIMTMIANGAPP